ncbi:hypothetical protein CBR_g71629 [Chara braunii]|uniref:RRM domain-containing protein n=1 Tax=Chara braunii TaxID=69332 RepID=A0A388MFY9_CHABU|nr:hypothetical protein CBR_g71629 [Chara braunii]|eukprot:GBG93487.1 hypothetical protein CBR_g71629 [Chara braunii]
MSNCIKVTGVSMNAKEKDLREFFSFSGDIETVHLSPDASGLQTCFIVFKSPKALDTALLLTGAKIVDEAVEIKEASPEEVPGHDASAADDVARGASSTAGIAQAAEQGLNRAQKMISTMLAKGYTLGKDAAGKAKAFDEKHNITASAAAKAEALDRKLGLSERLHASAQGLNQQLREVDEKFHVTEKTRGFFSQAEDKVNEMGTAVIKSKPIQTTSTWIKDTFEKVVSKAMEKKGQSSKNSPGGGDPYSAMSGDRSGDEAVEARIADLQLDSSAGGSSGDNATEVALNDTSKPSA